MKANSVKIKCQKPFGVIVSKEARKYAQYALAGAKKVLIVSDETVFRLYGNGMKKLAKNAGAEVFTFIYPAGENGKTKHVLDKLIILMTELNIKKTDCLVAFGGSSVASLTGFACSLFKGGVPYVFIPTTFMGMISPLTDGKVGVDFIGKKDLLRGINYPVAVLCDIEYLQTLPAPYMQDGYAEILRRAMIADGGLIELLWREDTPLEQLITRAIKLGERLNGKGLMAKLSGAKRKAKFAIEFSTIAQKICGLNVSYGKLISYGMVTAIDVGMSLGVTRGLEDRILKILDKYGIKWDIGITDKKLWQTIIDSANGKITLVLPKKAGKCRVVKLTEEKIKETF